MPTIFNFANDAVKTTVPWDCKYVPLYRAGLFRQISDYNGSLLFLFPLSSMNGSVYSNKTTVSAAMKNLFYNGKCLSNISYQEMTQTCPCEISFSDPEASVQRPIVFEPFGIYYGQQVMMCIFIRNNFDPDVLQKVLRNNFWENLDQYRITQENLLFYFNSEVFRSPLFRKLAPFAKKMIKLCMEKNINFVCDRGEFITDNFKLKQYQKDKLSKDDFFDEIKDSLSIVCDTQFQ